MFRTSSTLLLSILLAIGCAGTRSWLDEPMGEDTRTEEEIIAGEPDARPTRGDTTGNAVYWISSIFGLGLAGFGVRTVLKTRRVRRGS